MNTRCNTTAPVVPASEPDPVVAIGRALGHSRRRQIELEHLAFDARDGELKSAAHYIATAEKHTDDQTDALYDSLAATKATTLEGAMIQVASAISRLDMLWDQIPKEIEHRDMARDYRATDRLLFSALDVLEALSAKKIADLVDEDFANPRLNPWLAVEKRCPQLEEAAK